MLSDRTRAEAPIRTSRRNPGTSGNLGRSLPPTTTRTLDGGRNSATRRTYPTSREAEELESSRPHHLLTAQSQRRPTRPTPAPTPAHPSRSSRHGTTHNRKTGNLRFQSTSSGRCQHPDRKTATRKKKPQSSYKKTLTRQHTLKYNNNASLQFDETVTLRKLQR